MKMKIAVSVCDEKGRFVASSPTLRTLRPFFINSDFFALEIETTQWPHERDKIAFF
jgi:hypothetical protein